MEGRETPHPGPPALIVPAHGATTSEQICRPACSNTAVSSGGLLLPQSQKMRADSKPIPCRGCAVKAPASSTATDSAHIPKRSRASAAEARPKSESTPACALVEDRQRSPDDRDQRQPACDDHFSGGRHVLFGNEGAG